MNSNEVYITGTGAFLPGEPVENDNIIDFLGDPGPVSRLKNKILKSNGIKKRYYAMRKGGVPTFLSEDMAEKAIVTAIESAQITPKQLDCIAAGSSIPELFVPSLCQLIHGRLGRHGAGPLKTIPTAGVCLAGMTALESAFWQVKSGNRNCIAVCGVERVSVAIRSSRFKLEFENKKQLADADPTYSHFHGAFLPWMLSDGAGSLIVQNVPNPDKPSLRIDWIETTSYANELPTCMWAGTNDRNNSDPSNTWIAQESALVAEQKGMIVLRQDTSLLEKYIAPYGLKELTRIINTGKLLPAEIDVFLPHLSSFFFKEEILRHFNEAGIDLGEEKWFTNLEYTGNTGSAAIFIIIDEALKSGRIKRGDKVLIMVPESARFAYCYAQFTCV